jgi:hypothetical protein
MEANTITRLNAIPCYSVPPWLTSKKENFIERKNCHGNTEQHGKKSELQFHAFRFRSINSKKIKFLIRI